MAKTRQAGTKAPKSKSDSRICFDRILPGDMRRLLISSGPDRLAVFRAKKWANGAELRVRFRGGTAAQRAQVEQYAVEWSDYAHLTLRFNNAASAEIRITFDETDGSWSYVGTDALSIPRNSATMNFGWLDQGVVLHEFGHAIGLIHEHQNPVGGIRWNRDAVIRALSGPPNFWDLATIEHNMFRTYDRDQLNATELDPDSVMMYAIPNSWTIGDFETNSNDTLSDLDKSYIGNDLNYPKPDVDGVEDIVELQVAIATPAYADLGRPGEEDLFQFEAANTGPYVIETVGETDVVMRLFGPGDRSSFVAEDDDSGQNRNSRIEQTLIAGTYYVQIRHYSTSSGTGDYGVKVTKT